MVSSTFLLISLAASAHALNDWSKPCLSGVCSYDIPATAATSSGSLKIWGASDAISDITTAAGWEIIGCSPDKLAQDIRLVCNSEDSAAAGCSHLYEAAGAEGKVVRLPESCGKNAFARVARAWIPEDQSIPSSIAGKIVRRDGSQPQVKALALDTNFNDIDASKTGPVNFAVRGANVKGAAADIDTSTVNVGRRSRIYGNPTTERGIFDFVGDAVDSIKNLNTFDVDKSKTLSPLTVNKNFNLLNKQVSCPPITASLKIDVDAKANAIATIGVAASGTIVPPKVSDFAVITSLTGDIDGSVTMKATASGALDSGKLKIFEVGIPGLDFPGILTLGPTFEVNAQATAGLDIQADMTVGLNYHVEKAQLIFPPNSKKAQAAGKAFTVGDTPLKLSVSPSIKATGSVKAHLIPSLNLKVSALGDIVDAGIFLNLDASAEMILSLEGTAQASVTVDKAKREPAVIGRYMPRQLVAAEAPPRTTMAQAAKATAVVKSTAKTTAAVKAATTAKATTAIKTTTGKTGASAGASTTAKSGSSLAVTKDASASFGGCFKVNAGLDVGAGADASFFGLFDKNTKVSLFNKKFEILKKCFGNQKRSLAVISSLTTTSGALKKRALTCSAAGSKAPVNVANQVVQAGTITPRA